MTRPSTGPGSRRYERYEANGEEIIGAPVDAEAERAKRNAAPKSADLTAAEQERQNAKDYENRNSGIPLHRGADEKTYQATIKGLHGKDYTDAEVAENERARWYQEGNTGTPLTHEGFSEDDQKRLKDAAKAEREVE